METIAAISTPIGVGGISMVRTSGPDAFEISQKVFKAHDGTLLKDMKGFTAKLGNVIHDGKCIDEVIALVFKAPKSFTGENMVQISCHGGIFITRCVLRSLLDSGASMAGPGEFTKRAFMNGKISLEKAESIMGLISSNYERERELNFSSYCGKSGNKIESLKNILIDLLSDLNAEIDYPDEDVPSISDKEIYNRLSDLNDKLNELIKNHDISYVIRNGLRTAIVGAPNVGKSTLMNLISNREKSIVTDIPGTTRDAIEENVIFGDVSLLLIDTAGIRETDDKIEKIGTERSKEIAKSADLIFMMLDSSREITNEELEILNSIDKNKVILILNKKDIKPDYKCDFLNISRVVRISAKTGEGIEELAREVSNFVNLSSIRNGTLLLATERQYDVIKKAFYELSKIINDLGSVPRDILIDMIKNVMDILSEFTGENIENYVVDSIFSKFCVGK